MSLVEWVKKQEAIMGNDQLYKQDGGKIKPSLVPTQLIKDVAEIREYGNNKYKTGGENNWKKVDMRRYVDALYRHLLEFIDDFDSIDAESGKPHYKHMACNMAFICEMMAERVKKHGYNSYADNRVIARDIDSNE